VVTLSYDALGRLDAHLLLAGTRIASVKSSRVLYYYRTRLGTVVATSLGGGQPGARYRYTPYGEVDKVENETAATRSELQYGNYLALTGGLYHMPARTYDARLKAFLQADEVDRYRYAYAAGDPVNGSDPTGLEPMAYMVDGMFWYFVPGPDQFGTVDYRWVRSPPGSQAPAQPPAASAQTQREGAGQQQGIGLQNAQPVVQATAAAARTPNDPPQTSVAEFEQIDAAARAASYCGVNPVTGAPGFQTDPRGQVGHLRTGNAGEFQAPRLGGAAQHQGIDINAPEGTPIVANRDGTVEAVTTAGDYGNRVRVLHDNGVRTQYAHLRNFSAGLQQGTVVREGQVIGNAGHTGNAANTEQHLHFEVIDGPYGPGMLNRIDPVHYLNNVCP